jgi:hypothetical protein
VPPMDSPLAHIVVAWPQPRAEIMRRRLDGEGPDMKRLIFVTLTASMLSVSGVSLAQTPVQPAPDASAPAPDAAPPAKTAARPKVPPIPGEA